MRKLIPLLLVLALLAASPAFAAAINADGASLLKKQVTEEMRWRIDMAKILGRGLSMEGNVAVTAQKGFYKVTLPHLAMLSDAKGRLDIGTVVLHAVPDAATGGWLLSGALPAGMTFIDEKGKPSAHIKIGSQHFSATWLPDQTIYPSLDAGFKNIDVTMTGKESATIHVADLQSLIDLKKNEDGSWSGHDSFNVAGIALQTQGKDAFSLSIDKATSRTAYDQLDITRAAALKNAMKAALEKSLPETAAEKQAFVTKYLLSPPVTANGIDSTFAIDKLSVQSKGTAKTPGQHIFIRHIAFAGNTRNAQKKESRVHIAASFDGLNGSFISPPLADIVPHSFGADLTLDRLPMKEIEDIFFSSMRKFSTVPRGDKTAMKLAKADMEAQELMLPDLMEKMGTSLSVKNTYLQSNTLDARLNGAIYANSSALSGAVGKMTLSLAGLDKAILKMKKEALAPDADPRLLLYLGEIITLQKKGIPTKTADGKQARQYIVELTRDGKILLNGQVFYKAPGAQAGMTPPGQKTPAPAEKMTPIPETTGQAPAAP